MTQFKSLQESQEIGTNDPVLVKFYHKEKAITHYHSAKLFLTSDSKAVSYAFFDGDTLDPSTVDTLGQTEYPSHFYPVSELTPSDDVVIVELLVGPEKHCESCRVVFEDGKPTFQEHTSGIPLEHVFSTDFDIVGWSPIPE